MCIVAKNQKMVAFHCLFLLGVLFSSVKSQKGPGVQTDSFYFTKQPSNQDVEEGKPIRLQCSVTPTRYIKYAWERNSNHIAVVGEGTRYSLEDGSNLQLTHADRDLDEGTYQCLARNTSSTYTSRSTSAKVTVYWMNPNVRVVLLQPNRKEDIRIDQEVKLKCATEASPQVQASNIIWYFNGDSKLPRGSHKDANGILNFTFQLWHRGVFHCRVFHAAGQLHSRPPFTLSHLNGSGILESKVKDTDFLVQKRREQIVRLKCPQRQDGETVYMWSHINKLGNTPVMKTLPKIVYEESNSVMVIRSLDTIHANIFFCETTLYLGASHSLFYSFEVEIAENYPIEKTRFSPLPEGDKPFIIRRGQNFTLRFYIDLTPRKSFLEERIPNPPPMIQWYDKSQNLIPTYKGDGRQDPERIHALYGRHLVINGAKETDTGTYSLLVTNNGGRETKEFRLVITFPPVLVPLKQLKLQFDENDRMKLGCGVLRVSGGGSNIFYWTKNGNRLQLPKSIGYINQTNGNLVMNSVKPENTGTFQCSILTKGYNQIFKNNPISVLVKGRLRFLSEVKTIFLEKGTQGRIPCQVTGFGEPVTTWYRLDENNKEGALDATSQVDGSVLIIQFVQPSHAGKYRCKAKTDYGNRKINMTITVVVGERPRVTYLSPNQTVEEGSRVVLNCKVSGDPTPQISWMVNNQVFNWKDPASLADLSTLEARRRVLRNGSIVIESVQLMDDAEYFCVAANKHAMNFKKSAYLRVLTSQEFDQLYGGDGGHQSILRTILIVVSSAVAYLGLIIGLTVFCSVRMMRKRKKRAEEAKSQENGHLLARTNGGSGLPELGFCGNGGIRLDGGGFDTSRHGTSSGVPGGEARSHLSGVSSGNSASLYTRTHFSGNSSGAPLDLFHRLAYPRHQLQTEGILGKGEFGEIFLARASNIQECEAQSLVVVKTLVSREPAYVHEFHRQIDMFTKLDHDYLAKMLGLCLEMEPQFLIMEYCDWGDLKQFLGCMRQQRANVKIPPLTQSQKITMCSQVAMAMEHLSNHRCVHRDLAARNILLTQDLDLKVTLLGLSRDVYANEYSPLRDRLVPLRWMAPEALFHDEYSAKSDVWAYAVFVWEIFTLGELPHGRLSDHEVLQAAKKMTLRPISPTPCPTELHSLLQRCWADNPRERPTFSEISVIMGDLTVDSDV